MLSLGAAWLSAPPQNTALTPNQPTDVAPKSSFSHHPDPKGGNWADHPEADLLSRSHDRQPAAKSHSGAATGTSGWRSSDGKPVDFKLKQSGPDHSSSATYMCTDINFEDSDLAVHNFGGPDFCCNVCNDNTEICCPSKDAGGNPIIVTVPHDEAAYKFNLCDAETTESYFRLDGVQTVDGMDRISVISKNLTEYNPVWPVQGGVAGYLNNGRKTGSKTANDLVQINLCANRILKMESCFVDASTDDSAVALSTAAVRFFDLDHGKNPDMGPEVLQFKCPGGTFTLYGFEHENEEEVEFLVHMSNSSKARERTDDGSTTVNGLPVHIYDCPDDEWVTLWSSKEGKGSDNPTEANIPEDPLLGPTQERSMVQVNFTNVDCFEVIFANLPDEFKIGDPDADPVLIDRLYNSLELSPENYPEVGVGSCPTTGGNCSVYSYLSIIYLYRRCG